MTWKETAAIDVRTPDGQHAARLEPHDTLTWGPAKAEWTFTVYTLTLGDRPINGLFTGDAVWDGDGRWLAAVRCINYAPGSDHWNYAPEDWQPEQTLVVIDVEGGQIGRAAFDPKFSYQPLQFEGRAVVYNKSKHGYGSPVMEMEVDTRAIKDWTPI